MNSTAAQLMQNGQWSPSHNRGWNHMAMGQPRQPTRRGFYTQSAALSGLGPEEVFLTRQPIRCRQLLMPTPMPQLLPTQKTLQLIADSGDDRPCR